jgi:hypothetical protein
MRTSVKYLAFFRANATTGNQSGYEYNNLRTAEKEIREVAVCNTFNGNSFSWYVEDMDGRTVSAGGGRVLGGKVSYYRNNEL